MFLDLIQHTSHRVFTLWTDTRALAKLCEVSQACVASALPLDVANLNSYEEYSADRQISMALESLLNPSSDLLGRLWDVCALHNTMGDRFLRSLLRGKGERPAPEPSVRRELVEIAIRSFFGAMWNYMPNIPTPLAPAVHKKIRERLDVGVLSGPKGGETAVVAVTVPPSCLSHYLPAIRSRMGNYRLAVHHPEGGRRVREMYLQHIISFHTPLLPAYTPLRMLCEDMHEYVHENHLNHVMGGEQGRYVLEISDTPCFETQTRTK